MKKPTKSKAERNRMFSEIHTLVVGGTKVPVACARYGVKSPANYYLWKKRFESDGAGFTEIFRDTSDGEVTFKFANGTVVITTRKDLCVKALQLLVTG